MEIIFWTQKERQREREICVFVLAHVGEFVLIHVQKLRDKNHSNQL